MTSEVAQPKTITINVSMTEKAFQQKVREGAVVLATNQKYVTDKGLKTGIPVRLVRKCNVTGCSACEAEATVSAVVAATPSLHRQGKDTSRRRVDLCLLIKRDNTDESKRLSRGG
jgi:hypothetical protein